MIRPLVALSAMAVVAAGCTSIVDVTAQVDYLPFGTDDGPGGDDGGDTLPGGGDQPDPRSGFVEAVMQAAPVAWYRFGRDDLGGLVAHDRTAGARHGSTKGGAAPGAFGALARDSDTALSLFEAPAGGVDIPDLGLFDSAVGVTFSVSVWVNLHHAPIANSSFGVLALGTDPDGPAAGDQASLRLVIDDAQHVRVRLAGTDALGGTRPVPIGRWTLVTLVSSSGGLKLYVDDALDGQSSSALPAVVDRSFHFGGGHIPLAAHLDEAMFFNREVSVDELHTWVSAAVVGGAGASCTLTDSTVQSLDNPVVIENTRFVAPLTITANGVVLRNCAVVGGLSVVSTNDVVLEDVAIEMPNDALATIGSDIGLYMHNNNRTHLTRVRITGASQPIVLQDTDSIVARFISVRGTVDGDPSYVGVHVNSSSGGAHFEDLEIIDFDAAYSGPTSLFVERPDFELQRALISGNPAVDSVGVLVNASSNDTLDVLTDVDINAHNAACLWLVHTNHGDATNLRCRDTLCNGLPAGQPDVGFGVRVDPGVGGTVEGVYANLCGPPYEAPGAITFAPLDFAPRQPMNAWFCWE